MTDLTKINEPLGELDDATIGALLRHFWAGGKIELYLRHDRFWKITSPIWSKAHIYRAAPEPRVQDSINWDHVSDECNWMARDANGTVWLYETCPTCSGDSWLTDGDLWEVITFASYKRGNTDWTDSLVIRPGFEGAAE